MEAGRAGRDAPALSGRRPPCRRRRSALAVRAAWRPLAIAALALAASAGPATGAPGDPLWVFAPKPPKVKCKPEIPTLPSEKECTPAVPPPYSNLNGPCGLGVDSAGSIYISDHYRHNVNVFLPFIEPYSGYPVYAGQLSGVDPLSGPCAVAFDAADNVYVNTYHRSVIKYDPGSIEFPTSQSPATGTVIAGAGVDSTHPTGVAVDPASGNVYVNARTHIAVYDSAGAPVMDGAEPLRIGLGDLEDGYGVAFSQHPATLGQLYVPDAATATVKVYDPAIDTVAPVAEIDGSATPAGTFISLRDAAVAVDRVSGDVYVVDNTQPRWAEQPLALVHVFAADGSYEGHLKHPIKDALPPGLAVDNSSAPTYPAGTQGQVYVTSGNTLNASVYAYPPGAAITPPPLPAADVIPDPGGAGATPPPPFAPLAETAISAAQPAPAASGPTSAPAPATTERRKARRRHDGRSHRKSRRHRGSGRHQSATKMRNGDRK